MESSLVKHAGRNEDLERLLEMPIGSDRGRSKIVIGGLAPPVLALRHTETRDQRRPPDRAGRRR